MKVAAKGSVVLFGATSYVGQYLIEALVQAHHPVVAVSRNPSAARIVLGSLVEHVSLAGLDEIQMMLPGGVSTVVNAAYVKTAGPHLLFAQNRSLMTAIDRVATHAGAERVIHLSTMAVFGYTLHSLPTPRRARWRFGDPYIESKIHAERLLLRLSRGRRYALAIVRLGNVIGPGSQTWIAPIGRRLLIGQPVGYEHSSGMSNCTYVENAADYLRYLSVQSPEDLAAFGPIHHLAEFSNHLWKEIIDRLAKIVGTAPRRVERLTTVRQSALGRLGTMARRLSRRPVGGVIRRLAQPLATFPASSRLLEGLKDHSVGPAEGAIPSLPDSDRALLAILAEPFVFSSHVLPNWNPPIGFHEACNRIEAWLDRSGFRLSHLDSNRLP